jgi:hypothetical protein
LVLQAIQAQLAPISVAGGYNTDIGARFFLNDSQRDVTMRPSIAIGGKTGTLDLTTESTASGAQKSKRARRMDLTIEAAVDASPETAEHVGHLMLEDIERAWAIKTCGAPTSVVSISLSTWTILDRPDGIAAVVLQILGSAEYARST